MTPELWKAKKIVDATLHPGTVSPRAWAAAVYTMRALTTGTP